MATDYQRSLEDAIARAHRAVSVAHMHAGYATHLEFVQDDLFAIERHLADLHDVIINRHARSLRTRL